MTTDASGSSQADDSFAAVAYWSENIRPRLGDLPIEGLRFLRDQYIRDVLSDDVALPMLRDWWRTYGSAKGGSEP